MAEQPGRAPRTVYVTDHIWEAFGLMADEMGTDRDGLVNQALFSFARQNGYLTPGQARPAATSTAVAPVAPAPVPLPAPVAAAPVVEPEPEAIALAPKVTTRPFIAPVAPAPVPSMPPPVAAPVPLPSFATAPPPVFAAPLPSYDAMAPLPSLEDATPATGVPAAVMPPAPSFENFGAPAEEPLSGSTMALKLRPSAVPTPGPFAPTPAPTASYGPPPTSAPDLGTKMSPDEVRAAQERVLQKAAELERLVRGGPGSSDDGVDDGLLGGQDEGTPSPIAGSREATLVLYAEGREVDRVTSAPFLIGRGKHCDLIINSGKVSREHARIVREGEAFFIEDLGSSNGTWFDKKRITRRRVEHGDEYFICSEKLTCQLP